MKYGITRAVRGVVVAVLLVGMADGAGAGPLNPLDFPLSNSGTFPTAAGTFTFDTGALTLTGPGITTPIRGTLSATGVAVFDFNAINVGRDQVFQPPFASSPNVTFPPLALLSRGDITINGMIDVSAHPFIPDTPGGPGGFGSERGPGAGGPGAESLGGGSSGGGGGFGGSGGNGGKVLGGFLPTVIPSGGGPGGSSYGDLAVSLQGGSGGGSFHGRSPAPGGGGGGAIEIGAVGGIAVGGGILANGSSGAGSAGGGSGGGIFLHGNSVALLGSGALSATGGDGGFFGGGGGGGGRVLIQVEPGGFTGDVGSINVSGGAGTSTPSGFPPGPFSEGGAPGVFAINVVPEPVSLVLLGIGLFGVLGYARHAGRRAAA